MVGINRLAGPSVTPNAGKDQEWRQEVGYGYSGILVGAVAVAAPPAVEVPAVAAPGWVVPPVQRTYVETTTVIFPQWWVSVREELLTQKVNRVVMPPLYAKTEDVFRPCDIQRIAIAFIAALTSDQAISFNRNTAKIVDQEGFVNRAMLNHAMATDALAKRTRILHILGIDL